jgi:hypothetical protein
MAAVCYNDFDSWDSQGDELITFRSIKLERFDF